LPAALRDARMESVARTGVRSLMQGARTHPAHADGRLGYNGADWYGQNGNP